MSVLSEKAYTTAAAQLNCAAAAIKAVDAVESRGAGMDGSRPKILFEPHVWWKELRKIGVNPQVLVPTFGDMLYPVWQKKYPAGQDAQHQRLARAMGAGKALNKALPVAEAALKSCSWGRYQIMGFNHKAAGCTTIHEFVAAMYKGDEEHLHLFVVYINAVQLDDELRAQDWAGFARGYNGPLYHKNAYDKKLKAAYDRHK